MENQLTITALIITALMASCFSAPSDGSEVEAFPGNSLIHNV